MHHVLVLMHVKNCHRVNIKCSMSDRLSCILPMHLLTMFRCAAMCFFLFSFYTLCSIYSVNNPIREPWVPPGGRAFPMFMFKSLSLTHIVEKHYFLLPSCDITTRLLFVNVVPFPSLLKVYWPWLTQYTCLIMSCRQTKKMKEKLHMLYRHSQTENETTWD